MSELSIIHFLKITGLIDRGKKHEFEHTVKYTYGMLPGDCMEKTLSADIFENDTNYFFASWATETALRKFINSEEYQLIRSAYDAMGVLIKIEIGYHVEIKTIRIPY